MSQGKRKNPTKEDLESERAEFIRDYNRILVSRAPVPLYDLKKTIHRVNPHTQVRAEGHFKALDPERFLMSIQEPSTFDYDPEADMPLSNPTALLKENKHFGFRGCKQSEFMRCTKTDDIEYIYGTPKRPFNPELMARIAGLDIKMAEGGKVLYCATCNIAFHEDDLQKYACFRNEVEYGRLMFISMAMWLEHSPRHVIPALECCVPPAAYKRHIQKIMKPYYETGGDGSVKALRAKFEDGKLIMPAGISVNAAGQLVCDDDVTNGCVKVWESVTTVDTQMKYERMMSEKEEGYGSGEPHDGRKKMKTDSGNTPTEFEPPSDADLSFTSICSTDTFMY